MPLGKIVPLERTPAEQKVWDRVSKLKYPDDLETLKHLPRQQFMVWVAALHPREALLADVNDQAFFDVELYQTKKRWYHEVHDWLWRLIYDRKSSR